MPRHVVLLRRDPSLGLALRALLHGTGRVTELLTVQAWSALPAETVDAVVIDLPVPRRTQAVDLVRSSFGGRLVLVLDPSDDPAAVPSHHDCSIVRRPFEIVELWHLVTTDPTPATSTNGERGPGDKGGAATAQTGAGERRPAAKEPGRTVPEDQGPASVGMGLAAAGPAKRAPGAGPAPVDPGRSPAGTGPPDEDRPPGTDASTWRWRGRRYGPATAIPPDPPGGGADDPGGTDPGAPADAAGPSAPPLRRPATGQEPRPRTRPRAQRSPPPQRLIGARPPARLEPAQPIRRRRPTPTPEHVKEPGAAGSQPRRAERPQGRARQPPHRPRRSAPPRRDPPGPRFARHDPDRPGPRGRPTPRTGSSAGTTGSERPSLFRRLTGRRGGRRSEAEALEPEASTDVRSASVSAFEPAPPPPEGPQQPPPGPPVWPSPADPEPIRPGRPRRASRGPSHVRNPPHAPPAPEKAPPTPPPAPERAPAPPRASTPPRRPARPGSATRPERPVRPTRPSARPTRRPSPPASRRADRAATTIPART